MDPRITRLKALIVKESYQIVRDPSSILIAFVLPLILLFIYGFGVSLDANHIKIGLVLEDNSQVARSFAQSLTDSRFFNVRTSLRRKELEDSLVSGKIKGIVVVPSYFTSFLKNPNQIAPIQVIADAAEPNTANILQNYIFGVWTNWQQQEAENNAIQIVPSTLSLPRVWYNEELRSRYFLVPGSLAIIMTLIGTLLTALVIAREWERGTMEALISTPVSIIEILLGKLIPYFVMGMLSMMVCVMIDLFIYRVPLRGSIFLLAISTAIFLFAALGLGLFISSLARNQFVAAQVSLVAAFLPAFILSGFIFEISSMPFPIKFLTNFIPARYFVSSLQTIFLVGNVWELILPNLLAMLFIGLGIFCIVALRTTKRLD
jgi:ABC-2 type transport system permease protein